MFNTQYPGIFYKAFVADLRITILYLNHPSG